jgi:hypothetical protein
MILQGISLWRSVPLPIGSAPTLTLEDAERLELLRLHLRRTQGRGLLDPHSDLCDDLLDQLAPLVQSAPPCASASSILRRGATTISSPGTCCAPPASPLIAQNLPEAMQRAWPESLGEAPRSANLVLALLLLLIEQGLTLVEMPRLLTEPRYRRALLSRTHNAEVPRFFEGRFDRWGRERSLIIESDLNKVGPYRQSAAQGHPGQLRERPAPAPDHGPRPDPALRPGPGGRRDA